MVDKVREIALKILHNIDSNNAFSNIELSKTLTEERKKEEKNKQLSNKDIGFISEIVYGTTTWKLTIDEIIKKHSKIKLKKISPWIINIIRMGVYQIIFLDKVPKSAAVNESVELSKKYGHKASANFVNAILRKIEKSDYTEFFKIEDDIERISKTTSMPTWIIEKLLKQKKVEEVEEICRCSNLRPKLYIRVNQLKTNKETLIEKLTKEKIEPQEVFKPKEKIESKEVFEPKEELKPKEKTEPQEVFELKEKIEPKEVFEQKEELKPKEKIEPKEVFEPKEKIEQKEKIDPKEIFEQKEELKPKEEFAQKDFLEIKEAKNIENLKSYKEGLYTIQDLQAGKIATTLEAKENEKILDACSSPGGKTTYIAEQMKNKGEIIAWDIHEHRVELVKKAAQRLGIKIIKAELKDASKYDPKYFEYFDKILLDVPCLGLGVLKRKPDIKWQKKEEEISNIIKIQEEILQNCSNYLKKGGIIVYSTCSILKEENEDIVEKFVEKNKKFTIIETIKTYPNEQTDGFFICKIKKN